MSGIEWILLYMLLGAVVGFLAGLLGLGGGGILVPILTSFFIYQGVHKDNVVHLALGTAMACMIISSLSSIRAHALRGAVEWRAVKAMAPGIIVGGFLTTRLATELSSAYIAIFFSAFMALVAVQMFLSWSPAPSQNKLGPNNAWFNQSFWVGTGIGSVSALAAVGGGFLTIAFLTFRNMEIKKAIGTSAAIGFFIAIAGTLGYMINGWSSTSRLPYTLGFIYLPAFFAISITSILMAPYGVRWSHRIPAPVLKKIFAMIALVLSIKMLLVVV
ncbi:MAG: sulfite exporter TauE/SafE family protein [Pseudomonadota bacterium]